MQVFLIGFEISAICMTFCTEVIVSSILRIGIVGLGRLGKRHAENLSRKVQGASLVAAASPVDLEREWAEKNFGIATYESLDELLDHSDAEIIWLVTPTSLHADQCIQVLEAGKHVFCEKPLALDVESCDRVIEIAREHPKQRIMIGFMRRFDPAYSQVKREIENYGLGRIFRIHSESHDPIDPDGFFLKFAPTSGGIFLDCAIHDIDLTRWMLGGLEPKRVTAYGTRVMYPGLESCNDVDTAVATVEFEKDVLATFHVSRTSHKGYQAIMTVTGTEGAINCGCGLSELPLLREKHGETRIQGQTDFFSRFSDAFLYEANAFVASISSGVSVGATLEDAREATRLAIAIRESLEKGTSIKLD